MIIKSYEIEKKISNLIKLNLVLLYGENNGLKKDVREIIIRNFKKKKMTLNFYLFMKMKYYKMKKIYTMLYFLDLSLVIKK